MKKLIFSILSVLSALAVVSCEGVMDTGVARYGRTVILYMACDNNLSSYAEENLKDLAKGEIPDRNSDNVILVYKSLSSGVQTLCRYYMDEYGKVVDEVIETYPKQNSASKDVFEKVINRAMTLFPNDGYGLVLSSHSTGWLPWGYSNAAQRACEDPYAFMVKSFGEEDGYSSGMEIQELAQAIPQKFDFILMDCCLMGTVEVAYELRNKADYIIASPTEILAEGFPYSMIFSELLKIFPDYEKVCDMFYERYSEREGLWRSATVSLIATAELERLALQTRKIYAVRPESYMDNVSIEEMQPYFRYSNHWFYDFRQYVKVLASEDDFVVFSDIFDSVVLYFKATPEFIGVKMDPEKTSGLSTYLQENGTQYLDGFYRSLAWNKAVEMIR